MSKAIFSLWLRSEFSSLVWYLWFNQIFDPKRMLVMLILDTVLEHNLRVVFGVLIFSSSLSRDWNILTLRSLVIRSKFPRNYNRQLWWQSFYIKKELFAKTGSTASRIYPANEQTLFITLVINTRQSMYLTWRLSSIISSLKGKQLSLLLYTKIPVGLTIPKAFVCEQWLFSALYYLTKPSRIGKARTSL